MEPWSRWSGGHHQHLLGFNFMKNHLKWLEALWRKHNGYPGVCEKLEQALASKTDPEERLIFLNQSLVFAIKKENEAFIDFVISKSFKVQWQVVSIAIRHNLSAHVFRSILPHAKEGMMQNSRFEHPASMIGLSEAIRYNRLDILRLLLEHGADPNGWRLDMTTRYRKYPLDDAAEDSNIASIEILLSYGASLQTHSNALHFAIAYHKDPQNPKYDVVSYLLDKGMDINAFQFAKNPELSAMFDHLPLCTPLYVADKTARCSDMTRFLLLQGADPRKGTNRNEIVRQDFLEAALSTDYENYERPPDIVPHWDWDADDSTDSQWLSDLDDPGNNQSSDSPDDDELQDDEEL